MDDFVNCMTFAECLVRYVIESELGRAWKPAKSMMRLLEDPIEDSSPFEVKIGQSIIYVMLLQGEIIYSCYTELCNDYIMTSAEIEVLVTESVPHFFPGCYSHEGFVAFCGLAIGVSTYFYQIDIPEIAESIVGLIGHVLLAFMLTGEFVDHGGFVALGEVCSKFNTGARILWNKLPAKIRCRQRERVFGKI